MRPGHHPGRQFGGDHGEPAQDLRTLRLRPDRGRPVHRVGPRHGGYGVARRASRMRTSAEHPAAPQFRMAGRQVLTTPGTPSRTRRRRSFGLGPAQMATLPGEGGRFPLKPHTKPHRSPFTLTATPCASLLFLPEQVLVPPSLVAQVFQPRPCKRSGASFLGSRISAPAMQPLSKPTHQVGLLHRDRADAKSLR